MKKYILGLALVLCSGSFTSCYNTQVACGNMAADAPVVKVNSTTNHHFLYGLIPGKKSTVAAKDYVENANNYAVKTNMTFVNGLIGCLTLGIYTPTTTTFYIPAKDFKK